MQAPEDGQHNLRNAEDDRDHGMLPEALELYPSLLRDLPPLLGMTAFVGDHLSQADYLLRELAMLVIRRHVAGPSPVSDRY